MSVPEVFARVFNNAIERWYKPQRIAYTKECYNDLKCAYKYVKKCTPIAQIDYDILDRDFVLRNKLDNSYYCKTEIAQAYKFISRGCSIQQYVDLMDKLSDCMYKT